MYWDAIDLCIQLGETYSSADGDNIRSSVNVENKRDMVAEGTL